MFLQNNDLDSKIAGMFELLEDGEIARVSGGDGETDYFKQQLGLYDKMVDAGVNKTKAGDVIAVDFTVKYGDNAHSEEAEFDKWVGYKVVSLTTGIACGGG